MGVEFREEVGLEAETWEPSEYRWHLKTWDLSSSRECRYIEDGPRSSPTQGSATWEKTVRGDWGGAASEVGRKSREESIPGCRERSPVSNPVWARGWGLRSSQRTWQCRGHIEQFANPSDCHFKREWNWKVKRENKDPSPPFEEFCCKGSRETGAPEEALPFQAATLLLRQVDFIHSLPVRTP